METSERLMREGLVAATAAAKRAGLRVSVWTLLRWMRRGVRAGRLEAVKVGGRWYTSAAAMRRFIARGAPPPVRLGCAGKQTDVAAERYLESVGLGRAQAGRRAQEC
ncbi:MAG: DUF1580 domain-containing protein [Planctomycetota bacterium]